MELALKEKCLIISDKQLGLKQAQKNLAVEHGLSLNQFTQHTFNHDPLRRAGIGYQDVLSCALDLSSSALASPFIN
jgi:hypothetical protein